MKLKLPQIFNQRDNRWGSIILGYNTQEKYNIYNFGCLITCLGMIVDKTPDQVNKILQESNGFQLNSGLFIWLKCDSLGLLQEYVSPRYSDGPVTNQGIDKLKELLDAGHPLLCEIDFNPSTTQEEMHFVLAIGYEGNKVFVADPWTGQIVDLDIYGSAPRAIIQFRSYDKTLPFEVQDLTLQQEFDQCRETRDNQYRELIKLKEDFEKLKLEIEVVKNKAKADLDKAKIDYEKMLANEKSEMKIELERIEIKNRQDLKDLEEKYKAVQLPEPEKPPLIFKEKLAKALQILFS